MLQLSLAPLQGYTDFAFRNIHHKVIGGVDRYYSPYLRLQKDGSVKTSQWKEILPINNSVPELIPQIMAANVSDFVLLSDLIKGLGYEKINWNLGCPYPMVTRLGLGSGILLYPEKIDEILKSVIPRIEMQLSIKTRLGYESPVELEGVIPVFNKYMMEEIIIHPRIGKQLYKGTVDLSKYRTYSTSLLGNVAYNGDIKSLADFNFFREQFPNCRHIMIGRGLLYNPFLAREIKEGRTISLEEKRRLFTLFHEELFLHYQENLSGPSHITNKMISVWEYFSGLFVNQRKIYKQIKKKTKPSSFADYIYSVLSEETMI